MVLINDNHSKELQQIYSNFYQNLARQQLLVANWQLGDVGDETSESSSVVFQATQNEQLIDEIELTKAGIKSQQSTASSERLLTQLEILQSLPEGTSIPTAPSLRLQASEKQGEKTVSTHTVFATNELGTITKNVFSSSAHKKGTQVIHEQLSFLKEPHLVKYLDNLIKPHVAQREKGNIHQSLDPALLEAQAKRKQQPNNPNFWQQSLAKGGQLAQTWRPQHQPKQTAKKLYYLFSQNVKSGQSRFSQDGYTIVRQPAAHQDRYTVLNSKEQLILTFDVNQQQRLSLIESHLTLEDEKALSRLGNSKANLPQSQQQPQPSQQPSSSQSQPSPATTVSRSVRRRR